MEEDRRGERRLAGRVARHRIEVGADHRGVGVHVAESRQPLVVGPRAVGRVDEVVVARCAGRRAPAVLVAHGPVGHVAANAWVGVVAEHGERLAVPSGDLAEREHTGRRGVVARAAVGEHSGPLRSETGGDRVGLASPHPVAPTSGDERGAGRRGEPRRGEHDELAHARVPPGEGGHGREVARCVRLPGHVATGRRAGSGSAADRSGGGCGGRDHRGEQHGHQHHPSHPRQSRVSETTVCVGIAEGRCAEILTQTWIGP